MIKFVYKYYMKFPPMARKVVDFSIYSFMSGLMVDHYHSNVEDVLIDCDKFINQNL